MRISLFQVLQEFSPMVAFAATSSLSVSALASMPPPPMIGIAHYFGGLPDPRYRRARRHPLLSVLFILLCGMLAGADTPAAIARWAKTKRSWLSERVELPMDKCRVHTTPSKQTIGRVLAHLDPVAFADRFQRWTESLHRKTEGEVLALDGKTVRHSFDTAVGSKAAHLVSVWAAANRLVLSQRAVADHENEIVAIPDLLSMLDIRGCIISIDAMGCQKEIAQQITAQGADFILALKGNQTNLCDSVEEYFNYWRSQDWQTEQDAVPIAHRFLQTTGKGHGRIEVRKCWVVEDVSWLDIDEQWKGLRSIVAIEGERINSRTGQRMSIETRYFLSSLAGEAAAKEALRAVRAHWGIENRLHWCLDMVFREDESRTRKGHAPKNLAVMRKIAMNLLRREVTQKIPLTAKRELAAWETDYLETLLTGKPYQPDER